MIDYNILKSKRMISIDHYFVSPLFDTFNFELMKFHFQQKCLEVIEVV